MNPHSTESNSGEATDTSLEPNRPDTPIKKRTPRAPRKRTPARTANPSPAASAPMTPAVAPKATSPAATGPRSRYARKGAASKAAPRKAAATKKPARQDASPAQLAAADKPRKAKLVRDSFTMPKADFDLIAELKRRALQFQRPTKKSELLRAGLHALLSLGERELRVALDTLTPLKPGRPRKEA